MEMGRKRFTAEQIIGLLREADVKVTQGRNIGQICRDMGIAEQTYYRWRKEYGGMKTLQVKRLKELESATHCGMSPGRTARPSPSPCEVYRTVILQNYLVRGPSGPVDLAC